MRYALPVVCCLLSFSLSACGGEVLGIGSLVMQGLQMAGGSGSSSSAAPVQSGPFAKQNNAQEQQALNDVASRAVSQSCVGAKDGEAPASAGTPAPLPRSVAVSAPRQCGYQTICLPGNARPVRMLICEKPGQTTTAASAQTP